MRWLTNFYDFRFKWTATAAIGIHPTKAWLSQQVNFKNAILKWGYFRRSSCNEMDKDRSVSIETISAQFDVSVGTVHIIIREQLKMRKICTNFVPRVFREDQKERHCHDSREMVALINSDPTVLDALVTCDKSWIYCYDPETKRQSSQWKHAGSPRPKKARQTKSTLKLLMIPFLTALAWSTCTGFPLDGRSTRNTMLRF